MKLDFCVSHNYTQRDLLLLPQSCSSSRHRLTEGYTPQQQQPPPPLTEGYTPQQQPPPPLTEGYTPQQQQPPPQQRQQ